MYNRQVVEFPQELITAESPTKQVLFVALVCNGVYFCFKTNWAS